MRPFGQTGKCHWPPAQCEGAGINYPGGRSHFGRPGNRGQAVGQASVTKKARGLMLHASARVIFFVGVGCSWFSAAYADTFKDALDEITDTAQKICNDIPTTGERQSVQMNGMSKRLSMGF
jgi:hypothetical protein